MKARFFQSPETGMTVSVISYSAVLRFRNEETPFDAAAPFCGWGMGDFLTKSYALG
jgi:hypothetical protein